jgi:hypothetical protein
MKVLKERVCEYRHISAVYNENSEKRVCGHRHMSAVYNENSERECLWIQTCQQFVMRFLIKEGL